MEWQIMNGDGLGGMYNGIGAWIEGKYEISDECKETLNELVEKLQDEDTISRSVRRQLAVDNIAQKDLVPILTEVEDDPGVFKSAVRLLVNLTQPIECLQQLTEQPEDGYIWLWDVEKMLIDVKTACSNEKFVGAIFKEMRTILEDGQADEYCLPESDCDKINQSLLLIRNLLHIQDGSGQGTPSGTHLLLLKCLFQCGIDKILMDLLNMKQKDHWGVIVVQLISLLYKDLVSEIFLRLEDVSSCGEESCDSSNCSQCEAAMDRQFICSSPSSSTGTDRLTDSRPLQESRLMLNEETVVFSSSGETETIVPCPSENIRFDKSLQSDNSAEEEENEKSVEQSQTFFTSFQRSCSITHQDSNEKCTCQSASLDSSGNVSPSSSSVSPKSSSMTNSRDSLTTGSECSTDTMQVTIGELGQRITDFTTQFLQKGFSSLVHVLKDALMNENFTSSALDDSYFLWSVAFFLKFARRKEIEFKNIRDVFTVDVFGYLVYEAISNGESVLIAHKNKQMCSLTMRRLHLSVCALRELFKTLSFHRERGLSDEDTEFLEELQRDLANMTDLRQVFLWLVRQFKSGCHSNLFLRDVIVTNHYFLLLFEEWIGKDFVLRKQIDMLDHVKQFATEKVMHQYGHLLQNYIRNDHHVNNCVFTMMHHVAGDCLQPDTLMQVDILKTFIEILDRDFPITKEMNDLMEYVIQRFLSMAEDNPLSCAIQLFMGIEGNTVNNAKDSVNSNEEQEENDWTDEEEDMLVMWYNELEGSSDIVKKLAIRFSENGMNKSKLEIVNHLYKLGWLSSEELEGFVTQSKTDSKGPIQGILSTAESDKQPDNLDNVDGLDKLGQLTEEEVIPFCVKQLKKLGKENQLSFIQRNLLEVAYCKLDGDYVKKKYLEEPLVKYYTEKRHAAPLIFYNDEEEKYRDSMFFIVILTQLGFYMEEETGSLYPRIPFEWSLVDLVEKAKLLGEIKSDEVKFDISSVSDAVDITYSHLKSDLTKTPQGKPSRKASLKTGVPNAMWMNFIGQYNTKFNAVLKANMPRGAEMDTSL